MTALNGQQFSNDRDEPLQLSMFERTQDVIDKVHKIDADGCSQERDAGCRQDPREEWEGMGGIADMKLASSNMKGMDRSIRDPQEHLPPLRIQHPMDRWDARMKSGGGKKPLGLWDGHHRLAAFEAAGHTEVPVWHSFDESEVDLYTHGGYRR